MQNLWRCRCRRVVDLKISIILGTKRAKFWQIEIDPLVYIIHHSLTSTIYSGVAAVLGKPKKANCNGLQEQ